MWVSAPTALGQRRIGANGRATTTAFLMFLLGGCTSSAADQPIADGLVAALSSFVDTALQMGLLSFLV